MKRPSGERSLPFFGRYTWNPTAGTETFSWLHGFSAGAPSDAKHVMPVMPLGEMFLPRSWSSRPWRKIAFFVLIGMI